jgi:hypothetical protein
MNTHPMSIETRLLRDPLATLVADNPVALPPEVQRELADYLAAKQQQDGWWSPREYLPEAAACHAALTARQKVTAPPDVIVEWLRILSKATVNPTDEQLADRIAMIIAVLGEYPAYCWTKATLVAAARHPDFDFFPPVPKMERFLQKIIAHDRAAIHVTAELSSEKTRQRTAWEIAEKAQRRLEWAR